MPRRSILIPRLILTALAMIAIVGSVGCRRSAQQNDLVDDVEISLIVAHTAPQTTASQTTAPQTVGADPLGIRLATGDGAPIRDATIEIRGDMAHAGMVPAIGTVLPMSADGYYPASIEWTMAGDWIVTVTATLPDGRVATRQFPITIGSE